MKRVILTLLFFIFLLQIHAQENRGNTGKILQQSINNILKNRLVSGDTVWLYHKYDIYKWTDSGFITRYTAFIDYYPNSANIFSLMWTEYETDTLYKEIYQYDEQNRIVSTVMQNPANGTLINYLKTDHFYSVNGYDSLYIYYVWDENDSLWIKDKFRGIARDEYDYLLKDTTSVWNGQKWIIEKGSKLEYVLNNFGNILSYTASSYNKYDKIWHKSYKYDFYLTNDTTGEFDAYTVYFWRNNQWENGEKYTHVVLHNWQGWDPGVSWEIGFLIMELWDGSQWYYEKKDSIVYFDNGGNQINQFYWDEENNKWINGVRVNQFNNDNGFRVLSTFEEWNGKSWDTIYGDRYSYEYFRPELWRVMHYERYDTTTSVWGLAYDHVISEFSYVLNTPDIKSKNITRGFRIIPNPSDSNIQIRLNDKTERVESIEVFDMTGRMLYEKNLGQKQWQVNLEISAFKNGTYIIIVNTTNGNRLRNKFIKN